MEMTQTSIQVQTPYRRLLAKRDAKIRELYDTMMEGEGAMIMAVQGELAKRFRMTVGGIRKSLRRTEGTQGGRGWHTR